MTAHTCKTLTPGCYRCDLNRDEILAAINDIRAEAQAAWITYRDQHQQTNYQMRRREFIAGYLAANEITEVPS